MTYASVTASRSAQGSPGTRAGATDFGVGIVNRALKLGFQIAGQLHRRQVVVRKDGDDSSFGERHSLKHNLAVVDSSVRDSHGEHAT